MRRIETAVRARDRRSYTILKFLHVFGAIAWIGGAIMVTIFAEPTKRANEPGAMPRFARQVDFVTRVGQ